VRVPLKSWGFSVHRSLAIIIAEKNASQPSLAADEVGESLLRGLHLSKGYCLGPVHHSSFNPN